MDSAGAVSTAPVVILTKEESALLVTGEAGTRQRTSTPDPEVILRLTPNCAQRVGTGPLRGTIATRLFRPGCSEAGSTTMDVR